MGEFRKDLLPDTRSYLDAQGLKAEGRGKWVTTECRLHGGSDSLRWNLATGGWICMACGEKGGDVLAFHMKATGQDFVTAAKEMGAWEGDSSDEDRQRRPRALPAGAALQVLASEALLVAVAAANVAKGVVLSDDDRARLRTAAARVAAVREAYQ